MYKHEVRQRLRKVPDEHDAVELHSVELQAAKVRAVEQEASIKSNFEKIVFLSEQ
jgi:hypothetical protein